MFIRATDNQGRFIVATRYTERSDSATEIISFAQRSGWAGAVNSDKSLALIKDGREGIVLQPWDWLAYDAEGVKPVGEPFIIKSTDMYEWRQLGA